MSKALEKRLAALEETAAKVRVSEQDRENFERYRAGLMARLCPPCRAKVEEMEQHPSGIFELSQGDIVPKEHRNFQYAFAHAGICPSCREKAVDYLKEVVSHEK